MYYPRTGSSTFCTRSALSFVTRRESIGDQRSHQSGNKISQILTSPPLQATFHAAHDFLLRIPSTIEAMSILQRRRL